MSTPPQVPTQRVVRAYKFALDPSTDQAQAMASHAGAARFAYNWALAAVKANLDQRAAERTYDIPAGQLTPSLSWSFYSLRRAFNQAKAQVAPWWDENSKEAYATGVRGCADALANWSASKNGVRKGRPMGFPRFKARGRARDSVRFTTGVIRLETGRRHVTLPRLGTIRTHEDTGKLTRRITAGTARVLSGTVTRTAQRWFVSFTVEVQRAVPLRPSLGARARGVVGVDLGVKVAAALSQAVPGISDADGIVANSKPLGRALRRLRKANKALARTQRGSVGRRKAAARVARVHATVANRRRDAAHKLTSALAKRFAVVVVEDLFVAGMLRNRKLSAAISDCGWAEIRRQLAYKTTWYGSSLAVAGRFYPSSKTCSGCGAVKAKLLLSEREYVCVACGLVIDRDRNAALNLAALGAPAVLGSGPKTLNARGGDVRRGRKATQTPTKREAQTLGTVRAQALAPAA